MGSKEPNADPVKERTRQQKDELQQCFDENKRSSESNINVDAEKLEEQSRNVKFESRFTSKKPRVSEDPEKKPVKKMLLKPLVYDYKKCNPEKSVKKTEESKEEDFNVQDNLSTRSLAGSPPLDLSPEPSGTGFRNTSSSPGLKRSAPASLHRGPKRKISKRLRGTLKPKNLSLGSQMSVTVESVMAGAKPLDLKISKDGTVRMLRKMIKIKMKGVKKFTLSFKEKELVPEDSKLSAHGVTDGSKIQIYASSRTGTVDREEIAKLLKLGQVLSNFKDMVSSIPLPDDAEPKTGSEPPADLPSFSQCLEEENKKTKLKMAMLKSKIHDRTASSSTDRSVKKQPDRIFGRRSESAGNTSSGSVMSDVAESHSELSNDTMSTCSVANKEMFLYHDPPESRKIMELKETLLFDPPANHEELTKIREGFSSSCCALCFAKLPLALREMRCRCKKVYCSAHRNPEAHKCSVDLKEVDRQKLDTYQKRDTSSSKK